MAYASSAFTFFFNFYIKIKKERKIKENMKGAIVRELSISDRFLL